MLVQKKAKVSENFILDRAPEFYSLSWKKGTKLFAKKVEVFITIDEDWTEQLQVLEDREGNPALYTVRIETPVCADGECRLMHIRLYWDLLGNYAGYDKVKGYPFTKHDHDEFLLQDYIKLHLLLQDPNSILERRKIDELVEKPEKPVVEGVDALSGATIKEVKESVVSGALYSCYVAWHLVHGQVNEAINMHTASILDDKLISTMLYGNNTAYQLFALKQLKVHQYIEHQQRLVFLLKKSTPLVRSYILKKLPDTIWQSEQQDPFWEAFSEIDVNSRSLMLEHIDKALDATLIMLSYDVALMTKNQLKKYLEKLKQIDVAKEIKQNLEKVIVSASYNYDYLIEDFLDRK